MNSQEVKNSYVSGSSEKLRDSGDLAQVLKSVIISRDGVSDHESWWEYPTQSFRDATFLNRHSASIRDGYCN